MDLDLRKVAGNLKTATDEELLDRVTVFRTAMEPAAVDLIEGYLAKRGVTPAEIAAHDADRRATAVIGPDGAAVRCSFCNRPAVEVGRGWHRLWGWVPLFPRLFARCGVHPAGGVTPPSPPRPS